MGKEVYKFRCVIRHEKPVKTGWLFKQMFGSDFVLNETDAFITEHTHRAYIPDDVVKEKAIESGFPEKGLKVLMTERLPYKGRVILEKLEE